MSEEDMAIFKSWSRKEQMEALAFAKLLGPKFEKEIKEAFNRISDKQEVEVEIVG